MSAVISKDGIYRYRLERGTGNMSRKALGREILFVMLNPSTADATEDDNTIRRCKDFAARFDAMRLVVVNLFAFRATDPLDLWGAGKAGIDIVGPDNKVYIEAAAKRASKVVVAWGNIRPMPHAMHVLEILGEYHEIIWCLGKNKRGTPKHPLYLKRDQLLEFYVHGTGKRPNKGEA